MYIYSQNHLKVNTEKLVEDAEKSLLFVTNRPSIVMEKGEGMYLWDTDGKKYLDFIGGWAVDSLGHCPEVIKKALIEQGSKLINASPSFYNKPMIEFAKLLTENSCFDKVFFASTGAEANEGAIKLARKYGEKFLNGAYEIITTINGFHGRTIATMSASGKAQWKKIYEPKVPGFTHIPLNDIETLLSIVNKNTCAIMLEPIQGEGGVNEAEIEYIKAVREICNETGVLLIFDEVQTGIGRTGKLFGYEHYGIEPDIMTLAKGIGGGYPLSALLTKEKFNIFEPGDQGGTYCGQPLGMAVGLAVVNEVIEKKIFENARLQGNYLKNKLYGLQNELNIKNIRGEGLLIAFDFEREIGKAVVDLCMERGLIINSPRPSTIRLMPPLIVIEKEIDDMLSILFDVVEEICNA
jgi:acetylornithine/N-succinyldiaminopimelate aminotransferase